ncbi:MAG: 2,3,4,5-tetrahydropyridine-2,6-dicarboxylate N-succinyltransferase [Bacteroidota bacterium]
MTDLSALQSDIDRLAAADAPDPGAARAAVDALLGALEAGDVRSARRGDDGVWRANAWVKRGILLGFRLGEIVDFSGDAFAFFDKDTYPIQRLGLDAGVRIVPGGSTIRRGAHVAAGVVCMPPMYVNVGAYVGAGTMVDSHALVGSCGQIGERVHLSAAAQVGGVLEPIGAVPVVIEDDVFVGGGCGVYEGTVVRERAVLAAGVILTRSTRVYDLVNEAVLTAGPEAPLEIPAGAVVVPGARAVDSAFGRAHGLSLSAPSIVKYRDASTDASTTLEDALR